MDFAALEKLLRERFDILEGKTDLTHRELKHVQGKVTDLEIQIKEIREKTRRNAQDISDHAQEDREIFESIKRHLSPLDADGELILETKRQTTMLQTLSNRARGSNVWPAVGAIIGGAAFHFFLELWKYIHGG